VDKDAERLPETGRCKDEVCHHFAIGSFFLERTLSILLSLAHVPCPSAAHTSVTYMIKPESIILIFS